MKRKVRKISLARIESNAWLKTNALDVRGNVLSIGSGGDGDWAGKKYKDYFVNATNYYTSDVIKNKYSDLVVDVCNMAEIKNETYDCVFCWSVLEHVFNFHKAIDEITRILKKNGILILAVPFMLEVHMKMDYWRFTGAAIVSLFKDKYKILRLDPITAGNSRKNARGYCVKLVKV